jgi:hypothetical protein
MEARSPAQVYALVVGVVLTVAGIAGFFWSASFGAPGRVDAVVGVLDVNAWHNVVHIATGVLGLLVAGSYAASRSYALGLGVVYLGIAIWGFVIGDHHSLLGFVPVNTEDDFLHLLIGIAGLAAGGVTPAQPAPSTAA